MRKFLTTTAFLVLFVAFFSLMKCVVREAEVDWKEACEARTGQKIVS